MFRACTPLAALLAASFVVPAPSTAENWPHWRGPRFDGTSTAAGLPTTWSRDQNVRWRLEMPGPAASTPIVWGEHVFVTSTRKDSEDLLVLAIRRDGRVSWRRVFDQGRLKIFQGLAHETSPASPSPVTDGEHLWVLFGTANLYSLDFGGEVVWKVDLAERYGRPNMFFGLSASPLLYGDRLFLQLLHADAQLVVALDKATGREVWRRKRPTDARDECLHSYASPIPYRMGGQELVIVHGADYTTAHRQSDGAEVWRHGGLNPADGYNPAFRLVATPVVADGLVVVPSAKRGPVYGLRPSAAAQGDITGSAQNVAWKLERGTPDVPSPVVHDGLVYLNGENGTLTVLDATNGETVYDERMHQSTHRGSPVVADGKVYLTATDGTVTVVRLGRTFEVLAKNTVDERLAASPAISDGVIYLRSYEALYAIAKPPAPAGEAPSSPR